MVLIQNKHSNEPIVKWIGPRDPLVCVPHLQHKNVFFYTKCLIGAFTLSVGDFVFVSNADATDPDTTEGCDVAKILHLYELREMSNRDPCRAIVQWYSRPECIPHKHFDSDEICIDFATELIEEHRPYDSDISLEAVFRKCSVICGPDQMSAARLLENFNGKRSCAMFVCRYKFIKVKNSYRLVPLQFSNEDVCTAKAQETTAQCTTDLDTNRLSKKSHRSSLFTSDEPTVCSSFTAVNNLEFIDLNYFNTAKVSPIKIVGGRSVVRVSGKKRSNSSNKDYIQASPLGEKKEAIPTSPLGEKKQATPTRSRVAVAKRNLNLSLNSTEADISDSLPPNYSIVKNSPDSLLPFNSMKIKLRISER